MAINSSQLKLKGLRLRLGITTRDVERLSRKIANAKGNEEYYLSHGWLTQIENAQLTPSIYKLYSLSAIYRSKFTDLLALYGLNLEDLSKNQMEVRTPKTQLIDLEILSGETTVEVPIQLSRETVLERTNLLSRMFERWVEIPVSLIRNLDLRRSMYGYVGLEDYTLHPMIRPGSFVQIDSRQIKIVGPPWPTEFDRPVYFLELRDGFAYGWCELEEKHLSIVPHPNSPAKIRRFSYPGDVDILGRVTAVAMRIVDSPA